MVTERDQQTGSPRKYDHTWGSDVKPYESAIKSLWLAFLRVVNIVISCQYHKKLYARQEIPGQAGNDRLHLPSLFPSVLPFNC